MGPPKIPQADWSKHKAYLHDLYITKDRTLSQVIQQAENELGFRPRYVNVETLTLLIILTMKPVRHNTYDSSRNGSLRRICVGISGRGSLRSYAIGSPLAKIATYLSKTGECLIEDCERKCPATGPRNMMIVRVSKSDCVATQNPNYGSQTSPMRTWTALSSEHHKEKLYRL